MAVSMYMGEPLSGEVPSIAIDLYDRSLKNFAPAYLTHLLNQKIMNRINDKSCTYVLSSDKNTLTATYDDGSREVLVINDTNQYIVYSYSSDGELLEKVTTNYDEKSGKIRTTVSTAGGVNGIVPFATATFSEIAVMLKRHYAGIIDLSEYWNVGDSKQISYTSIEANGVGESHVAATQYVNIIGFNHDDITGGGKAAVSLQFVNGIGNAGYMNKTATNVGGWRDSDRRTWANNAFYNALDPQLRALIKPVDKLSALGNKSSQMTITSDYVFFLSESELVGTGVTQSYANEGNQYTYYQAAANRKKSQSDLVTGYDNWYTRSPAKANAKQFVYVESDGDLNVSDASTLYRLAPAFVL
jgi:hypothetical protein